MSKVIKINTDLFKPKTKSQKRVPTDKSNKSDNLSNNIKKKLINRIRNHKNKESSLKNKNNNNEHSENVEHSDEFEESIKYLEKLTKEKQQHNDNNNLNHVSKNKNKNKTMKHQQHMLYTPSNYDIQLQLPNELLKEPIITNNSNNNNNVVMQDVPYGVLKGGNKPTYREWNKTQKKNYTPHDAKPINKIEIPIINNDAIIPRQQKLEEIKKKHNESMETMIENKKLLLNRREKISKQNNKSNLLDDKYKNKPIDYLQKKKKTIKNKYNVGKNNTSKKISVLLKDINTRKEIISSIKNIKNVNVHEMKEYLLKHNLLKSTSYAPNDIIRKMYESAILTGDLVNKSTHNLQENFDNI